MRRRAPPSVADDPSPSPSRWDSIRRPWISMETRSVHARRPAWIGAGPDNQECHLDPEIFRELAVRTSAATPRACGLIDVATPSRPPTELGSGAPPSASPVARPFCAGREPVRALRSRAVSPSRRNLNRPIPSPRCSRRWRPRSSRRPRRRAWRRRWACSRRGSRSSRPS